MNQEDNNSLLDNIKKLQLLEQEMYSQLQQLHNQSCVDSKSVEDFEESPATNLRCKNSEILNNNGKRIVNYDNVDKCLLDCKNNKDCKSFSYYTNTYTGNCMLCKDNIDSSMGTLWKTIKGITTRSFNKVNKEKNTMNEKCSQNIVKKQNEILKKINKITNVRLDLFKKIQQRYDNVSENLDTDKDNLKSQMVMVNMVEEQINDLKSNIKNMKQDKNNRLRMVQIGTYEFKRYQRLKNIMQSLFVACLSIAAISVALQNGLLPSGIASGLIFIIFIVVSVFVFYKMYDLSFRRTDDFDKYNFLNMGSGSDGSTPFAGDDILTHDKKFFEKLISDTDKNVRNLERSTMSKLHQGYGKLKKLGKKAIEKSKKHRNVIKLSVNVTDKKPSVVEGFQGF